MNWKLYMASVAAGITTLALWEFVLKPRIEEAGRLPGAHQPVATPAELTPWYLR